MYAGCVACCPPGDGQVAGDADDEDDPVENGLDVLRHGRRRHPLERHETDGRDRVVFSRPDAAVRPTVTRHCRKLITVGKYMLLL